MRIWLFLIVFGLAGSALGVRSQAHAQAQATDKAAAEALFDRGIALLRDGKIDDACKALEQSQAVESGIGTMLYLADCYERQGRTASAWALFREAGSQAEAAGQSERAEAGRQRSERLTPLLATLAIDAPQLPPDATLSVTRGGTAIPLALLGVALPVDPGEHAIEARAPGYAPFSTRIHIAAQGAFRVSLPALNKLPPQAIAAAQPARGPAPIAENEGRKRALRWTALGVGGAAVVGVVLGGVFGIRAIVKHGQADDQCGNGDCSSTRALVGAQRANDSANHAARASNGLWITGAVLGASAAALYFTAPLLSRERNPTASAFNIGVSPRRQGAALELGGAF